MSLKLPCGKQPQALHVGAPQVDVVPPLDFETAVLLGLGVNELLEVGRVDVPRHDGHRGGEGARVAATVQRVRPGSRQAGEGLVRRWNNQSISDGKKGMNLFK